VQVLQNHLAENPTESASTWMYLLDLLVQENMQEEYEVAAIECNKHFNINVAAFSEGNHGQKNTLESFERISAQLQKLWGTPAALTFLDELIFNTRLEPRVGFSKEVFDELSLLREIASDEIRLDEVPNDSSIDLPEREISEEFKQFGDNIKSSNESKKSNPEEDVSFEFELVDIGRS